MLNRYFVPVYSSNEDARDGGVASPQAKKELQRFYLAYLNQGRPISDVHIYILTPDAQPLDGMRIGDAVNGDNLLNYLKGLIKKMGAPKGEALVQPTPQSVAPPAPPDSMVLHLAARAESRMGNYRQFPAENWMVLGKPEWTKLMPTGPVKVKDSWSVPVDVATKLLNRFYPQTVEISAGVERSRIDRQQLTLTVTSIREGIAFARFDGTLHMKHGTPAHEEEWFVDATLTGFLEFDPATHRIQRLRLVTKKATYKEERFSAALRSVSTGAP